MKNKFLELSKKMKEMMEKQKINAEIKVSLTTLSLKMTE